MLLVYFILRFGGTGATVPGGIFMPLFVLGTVIGALTGTILIHMGIIPASCYVNVIIISMAAYDINYFSRLLC
ncbi:chloride channel protein [Limosilactobacillus balticus]|uniref:chloride channel protein n=1 Tax=Limosilactobacillus balticus TaxID=2759747 RepID=UPI002D7E9572|nr:chloride channel protein [Limosilactobacillus balticus]